MPVDPDRSLREFLEELTGRTGRDLDEFIRARAAEPLPPEMLLHGEITVIHGRTIERHTSLTGAERRVLRLRARGLTNPETAEEMHVSLATVQVYVRRAIHRTGARNTLHAVVIALATGQLVETDG